MMVNALVAVDSFDGETGLDARGASRSRDT